MATADINSFVRKFLDLWKTGKDASLKLETSAGEARVSLELELGTINADEIKEQQPQAFKKVSPSQVRRRKRRAQARRLESDTVKCNVIMKDTPAEGATSSLVTSEDVGEEETSEEDVSLSHDTKEDDSKNEVHATEEGEDDDRNELQDENEESSISFETGATVEDDLNSELKNRKTKNFAKLLKSWKNFKRV